MTTRRQFLASMSAAPAALAAPPAPGRPNIILIMADDLGYSDISPYGGEIETPNLDRLARNGVRFSTFYNCARCCPTRSALLTGLYNHQAGVGHMINDSGFPAYRGFLNDRCVTIAEALAPAGYTTLMSGKWHVGEDRPHWPTDRGFQHYFGLISGASNYFRLEAPRQMALDDKPYSPNNDPGFYMTNAITDHAVRMLGEASARPNPFFLYLAYTSPHWPLHALPEDIAKYRGRYMRGWDRLRAERHERQRGMGLVDRRWQLSQRPPDIPAWSDVQNKEEWDLRMAVYAAQVDRMDRGIGRVLDALQKTGREENTLVLFLADNGGCAEENIGGEAQARNPVPGGPDSFTSYRRPWANSSNTPFRLWKQFTHEGGISSPLIARWPQVVRERNAITHQPGHVIDLMATCVDVAGAKYPQERNGVPITPLEGRSLKPALESRQRTPHEALFWEHQGHRAASIGGHKLVARNGQPWELYDIQADRTELNDLSAKDPARATRLDKAWQAWADKCGVRPFSEVQKRQKAKKAG